MIENQEELERVRAECHRMVTHYALASGAAGVLPLPGVDLAVDIFSLGRLLTRINERFGVSHTDVAGMDARTKGLLFGAIAGGGSDFIGKRLGRGMVRKLVERLGTKVASRGFARLVPLVGMAASASVSFAAMKAIGDRHVEDCHAAVARLLAAREGGAAT